MAVSILYYFPTFVLSGIIKVFLKFIFLQTKRNAVKENSTARITVEWRIKRMVVHTIATVALQEGVP